MPDVVLWRNSAGVAAIHGRMQRFGLCVGAADMIGIGPRGRFLAFEIKTPTGRVSPEQQQFLDLVRRRGGIAAVVRSVADAISIVEEARR